MNATTSPSIAPMRRHGENEVLAPMHRKQRRALLLAEERRRKSGIWPEWQHRPIPAGAMRPGGWAAQFHTAHTNEVFSVLERDAGHGIRHLMITSLSGVRPTWWEAQRIKNDIAGQEATAVELYPPQAEVIDAADAYHLWVLPAPFPVTLGKRIAP